MFGYPVLRSKPQQWIPELRFGYPPLRGISKSFWEKLEIFAKVYGVSAPALYKNPAVNNVSRILPDFDGFAGFRRILAGCAAASQNLCEHDVFGLYPLPLHPPPPFRSCSLTGHRKERTISAACADKN